MGSAKHYSRLREGIYFALEYCIQFMAHGTRETLSYQSKPRSGSLCRLEHKVCEQRLKELGLISLEKGKLQKRSPYLLPDENVLRT